MMPVKHLSLSAALLAMAATASAQTPPPAPRAALNPAQEAERLASRNYPNVPGSGPFAAIMETDAGLPNHVIYRPAKLPASKLGVMVWGNGGCQLDGASARQHLLEVASHGYLVIAPGRILTGPSATEKLPEPQPDAPRRLDSPTKSKDVLAGLDWALKENTRAGSRYKGHIDPKQTAVAGHSCGGLQALEVARDPRIHAVLVHNSGVFADGSNPIAGINVTKALLKELHTPVIYILGGPDDIAYPNGTDDFARIEHVPAVLVNLPVGHGGTFYKPYGGAVAQVAVDWLQWQLRGDKTAGRTFAGPACRLCVSAPWSIERKHMP
jgi:dienelactone hydrolase